MTTTVTLTGTGVPHPSPGRAGPGALVRFEDIALQFDAGRATVLRLAETDCAPHQLDAIFITHVHSDHVVDLPDLVMTRWLQGTMHPAGPLPIVAVEGLATAFTSSMLDCFADDIAVRMEHVQPAPPRIDLTSFPLPSTPMEVWRSEDGLVFVEAVAVHHEPVQEAVAYRVTTPDGVVVVSGDTRVCDEVQSLATGADVLVHEACRQTALADVIRGTALEHIFDYHADTVALGQLAQNAGVGHLLLTHLIPPPSTPEESKGFESDVRSGGFEGSLTVGSDLVTIKLS